MLIAWGIQYVLEALDYCLPALLSPNNLPALAETLDLEVVFVTMQDDFEFIERQPVVARTREICPFRLIPVDDLVFPNQYGLTITLANFRGIEDLGDEMVNTYLLFLFTDFICADGSLRTVGEKIKQGQRLIMAPSYQVLGMGAISEFRRKFDHATQSIAIAPREMAALILKHRHYLVRAKTINQKLFHCDLPEQFYYQVDDHTLVAKQAPFALVCMRPERKITSIETFWDYGIVSEACPNTRICALSDSDDFVMAEIQSPESQHTLLTPGWLSMDKHAARLQFTTADHRTCVQFTHILHSRDIPPGVAEARRVLIKYSEEVFLRAGHPTPHERHGFWAGQYAHYMDNVRLRDHSQRLFSNRMNWMGVLKAPVAGSREHDPEKDNRDWIGGGVVQKLYKWLMGLPPRVSNLHPLAPSLRMVTDLLDREIAGGRCNALMVHRPEGTGFYSKNYFLYVDGQHMIVSPATLLLPAYPEDLLADEVYDVCVCELSLEDLKQFQTIHRRIRKHVKPGGKIIAVGLAFDHPTKGDMDAFMRYGCPMQDASEIWFVGSALRRKILRWRLKASRWGLRPAALWWQRKSWVGWLFSALAVLATTPLIILDNLLGGSKPTDIFFDGCMTGIMVITVQEWEPARAPGDSAKDRQALAKAFS